MFNGLMNTFAHAGENYLHSNEAINSLKGAFKDRILENEGLRKAMLGEEGKPDSVGWGKIGKSMFYNRNGELQAARVGGAIAGSYIGANEVINGDSGIPFI